MTLSRPSLAMLRDSVLVAAIAVLTVQALKRLVGDRYLVPTGSMEPVFHGHPEHGDWVLVSKLASASALRVGDLVVIDHPSQPGQRMVKRIAARGDDLPGGCWIDIMQGDLWLGPDPQRMQREQKDPLAAKAQRATWAAAPGTAAARDGITFGRARAAGLDGPWSLPALSIGEEEARSMTTATSRLARRARAELPVPDGFLGAARPIDASCIDATGARVAAGGDVPVTDVGMEVAFAVDGLPAADCTVLAAIETRYENLTFHWRPRTGRVVLWRDGEDIAAADLPAVARQATLEFGLLDDRAFFALDGSRANLLVVPRQPQWNGDGQRPLAGVRSVCWLGLLAAQDAEAVITRLRVFRDVHRWRDPIVGMPGQAGGWPRQVPPGHWFLLGDSAFDSHDSRQFGPVASSAFVGVPWYVLGPWARRRWVTP